MERDIFIHTYFLLGLNYQEIMCALALNHRIVVSLRTLKRILSKYGLFIVWRQNSERCLNLKFVHPKRVKVTNMPIPLRTPY